MQMFGAIAPNTGDHSNGFHHKTLIRLELTTCDECFGVWRISRGPGLPEIRQLRKSYKFPTLRNPELKCV